MANKAKIHFISLMAIQAENVGKNSPNTNKFIRVLQSSSILVFKVSYHSTLYFYFF